MPVTVALRTRINQWGLFLEGRGPFRADADIQWGLLISTALGLAFALIVADILLDRFADDRLR